MRNVTAKNLAVNNTLGEVELLLSKEDLNHSLVKAIEPTQQVQKVQTITLEKILDRQHIGQVDLLKIDCEGAEFAILEDSPQTVYDRVSNIFLEYHDWVPGKHHRNLKKTPGSTWFQGAGFSECQDAGAGVFVVSAMIEHVKCIYVVYTLLIC